MAGERNPWGGRNNLLSQWLKDLRLGLVSGIAGSRDWNNIFRIWSFLISQAFSCAFSSFLRRSSKFGGPQPLNLQIQWKRELHFPISFNKRPWTVTGLFVWYPSLNHHHGQGAGTPEWPVLGHMCILGLRFIPQKPWMVKKWFHQGKNEILVPEEE